MKSISELMDLRGRKAIITGANGFIGKQMSATIAELGGDLVLVDRPGTNYGSLLKAIKCIANVKVTCVSCNLEDDKDRIALISELSRNDDPIAILINNAAFSAEPHLKGWVTNFENQSVEVWRRAIEVNLTAAFHLSKGLAPQLKKSGNGSIINVSSIYGNSGPDYSLYAGTQMGNPAAYAASKGGLIQLTRWLATTLAPKVRANVLSPGGVFRNQPEKFVKKYEKRTPLGRMATEEDFKGVIAYLASDLSSYVTGQNILVDGGWTAW
jgi:NAD(P)-dependent dehydrogenase (short-subunit alcohol dehydrogenase family)